MQDEPRTSRPGGRPLGALDPHSSLRARLGAEARTRRIEKGLSLRSLAELARSSSSHLSEVEHGRKLPSIGLVERLDEVLEAGGELIALFPSAALEQTVQRHKQTGVGYGHDAGQYELCSGIIGGASAPRDDGNGSGAHCTEQFARFFLSKWPDAQLSRPFPDYGADFNMLLPGGKALSSAFLNLQILDGGEARNNLLLTSAVRGDRLQQLLRLPSHALVIGAENTANGVTGFYGLGASEARRQSAACSAQETRLLIPRAYALDDFTYGILWAVSTLDNSLLADDFALSESWRKLRDLRGQRQSSAGPHASELSGVGQLYMGSAFCARHILSHYDELNEIPVFWTREQCGEEACTWLLFMHKYQYLLRTQGRFSDVGVTQLSRVFCIPEAAVVRSPVWERVLLFLSIALMESLQIVTHIFVEPEYTAVPGYVLAPEQRAITATWIRGDGLWNVDVTENRQDLREFFAYSRDAQTGSIVTAPEASQRLKRLASYLGLNFLHLARRCAEIASCGVGGLIQPRSRLLSTAGLEAACGFVAKLYRYRQS